MYRHIMQMMVQYIFVITEQHRLLPTLSLKTTGDERGATDALRHATHARYREAHDVCGATTIPLDVARQVVNVNVTKRGRAHDRAVAELKNNPSLLVPVSMLPTIMNAGETLTGLEDPYLDDDYPSHEVFAFNRTGKESFRNQMFARHCMRALEIAYPGSEAVDSCKSFRVKAHRIIPGTTMAVVSSKQTIGTHRKSDRETSLISRTAGLVDLNDSRLNDSELSAIQELIEFENRKIRDGEVLSDTDAALFKSALQAMILDDEREGLVLPVIQTVYQTQSKLTA